MVNQRNLVKEKDCYIAKSLERQKQLIFVVLKIAEKCVFGQVKMTVFLIEITSCGDSAIGLDAVKFVDPHRRYSTRKLST